MKISIVIPTLNEELYIGQLLSSIANQTIKPHEVIVVDNGNIDRTEDIVKLYKDSLPIKYISAPRGVAKARNEGARKATGDYVYFVDADTTIPVDNLRTIKNAIESSKLAVAIMPARMPNAHKLYIRTGARLMNTYVRIMHHTPWPIGFSCFCVKRELFLKVGGFDTTIPVMEDYDLILRMKQAGGKVDFVKNTYFCSSDRRFVGNPGRIGSAFRAEVYRYTHGLKVKKTHGYEMGGSTPVKKKK